MALIALVPLTVGSVLIDGLPSGAPEPLAWYVGFIAFAVACVFFLVAGRVLLSTVSAKGFSLTLAAIGVFGATEVIRTLSYALLLTRAGAEVEVVLQHRITAGALTGILVIGLVSILVSDHAQYREGFRRLSDKRADLEEELSRLAGTIDEFIDTLRDTIRHTVDTAFTPILRNFQLKPSLTKLVQEIVGLSENVVRPLSLDIQGALPEKPHGRAVAPRVKARDLIALTTVLAPFQPLANVAVVFLLLFSASVFLLPFPFGVTLLASFIATSFTTHQLARYFLTPRLAGWGMATRFAIISAVYAASPFLVVLATLVILREGFTAESFPPFVYLVLITVFVSWGLAFIPALHRARENILQQVIDTTSDLVQARARAEVRLRREKQRLVATVHGDVQSILMATVLKLQRPNIADETVPDILESARSAISRTLADIKEVAQPHTVDEMKTILRDSWAGVVTIRWNVQSAAVELVESHPDLAEVVWQVVREAAANAVKHGHATRISVSAKVEPSHLILDISDNGTPQDESGADAGGVRLFQAVSDDYQLVRRSDKTLLRLTIPLPRLSTLSGDPIR